LTVIISALSESLPATPELTEFKKHGNEKSAKKIRYGKECYHHAAFVE
jgi:hypothetical protein